MDRSSYLDPSAIQAQCESAIQILNSDISALQSLDASLNLFAGNNEIWSFSFATLKQQIRDYTTITQAICMAHESDKMDYEVFKQAASQAEGVLDGEVIIGNKEEAERQRKSAEENRDYYNSLASRCFDPTNMTLHSVYIKQASFYQQTAWMWQKIYDKWQKKEDNYDEIEGQTGSLFTASPGMRAAIESAIAGIKGSFRVAEGKYVPDMNALWRRRIEDGKVNVVKQQLLQLELNEDEIQSVTKLGFTYDELWSYRCACETQQDKEFFKQLLIGTEESYIRAFQINPDEITGGMTIFMADYGYHLLELDSNKQITQSSLNKLMNFNNAILSAEYHCVDVEGNFLEGQNRDIYISRICVGTDMLLKEKVEVLASMGVNDRGYKELETEREKWLVMVMLWSSEKDFIERQNVYGIGENRDYRITNLCCFGLEPQFTLNYFSARDGKEVKADLTTNMLNDRGDLDICLTEQALKEFRHKKNMAIAEMMAGIGVDVTDTGIPVVSNVVGGFADYYNAERELENYATIEYMKWFGVSGEYSVTYEKDSQEDINTIMENLSIKKEDMRKAEVMHEHYCNGIFTDVCQECEERNETYLVFSGEYDPNKTRALKYWQENGMVGWADEQITAIKVGCDVTRQDITEDDLHTLLYGNGVAVDHKDFPFNRFMKDLNNAIVVMHSDEGDKIESIQSQFDKFVENGGVVE